MSHAKKQGVIHTQEGKLAIETTYKGSMMVDLLDKNFKTVIQVCS